MAPLRAVVLVAAVVVAALVLANGFSGSAGLPAPVVSPSSPTPTTPISPTTSSKPPLTPHLQGLAIAVENATTTTGLAARAARTLQAAGLVIQDIGNAPAVSQKTVLYYRNAQGKVDCQSLRDRFFPGADVTLLPAGTSVPAKAKVAVYLGADYAASHP